MTSDAEERLILVTGVQRTIRYAMRTDGSVEARDFIDGLKPMDQQKLRALFDRLAAKGQIHNREQFKKVEDKIFEFKSFQIRIGCFQEGRTWYLTHGFIKKKDNWRTQDLERANLIRIEQTKRIESDKKGATK